MEYLIDYIDYDGKNKRAICCNQEEIINYELYCLELDLPYNVYKLTKL